MFPARGAEGPASKQSTPRSGVKGILRGTLSDRRMKGSRKPAGGAKQAEKQDGKKKPKATVPQTATQKLAEKKKLASALASHLQSLYKGEGVLVVEDDKRIIFYCTLCDVWAYHDASLIDHIHGKKHKRKQAEATPLTSPPSSVTGSPPWEKTSKLTPPWKLVGEGKNAVSSSSKRKAPHSSDASKSAGGGSKRQKRANGQDVAVTPGVEGGAPDIVPETEEDLDEPSRPEDFALALFKFTNLIGRRGKWEKQLLKWSDGGPGEKHSQKEELPLLADVPAEHPEEVKKQPEEASDKDVSRDDDDGNKGKEPKGTSGTEPLCTEEPIEVNADVEEARGTCTGDDSTPTPELHEAAAGRAEDDATENAAAPAVPVPEAATGVDASGDATAPAAVPAKRRKGGLGAGAGASATRVCFLCQLPMTEGQVVGALWNARLKQFACSSRNRHKKFHIFHSHCIEDWVVFCSAVASTSVPPALCCPLEADVAHLLSSMHRHQKAHVPSLAPSRQVGGSATPAAAAAAAAAGRVTTRAPTAATAVEAGGSAPVSTSAAAEATGNDQQGDAPQPNGAGRVGHGADADGSSASSDELHSDAWAWAGIPDAIHSSASAAAVATSALAAAAATGPVSSEDAAVVAIVATAAASAAASLMAPPPVPAPAAHSLGKRSSADTMAQQPGKAKSTLPASATATVAGAAIGAAGAANKDLPGKGAEAEAAVAAEAAVPAAAAASEGAEALKAAKLLPLTEVFCPECQGTGQYGPQNALEHPRYRLAQVFDWIVAMMVARHKATLAQKGSTASSGEEGDGGAGGETAEVGVADKGDATMADAEGAPEGCEKAPEGAEGASEGRETTPEGGENVERSAGREADKGLCDEREETAAEAAHPPPAATPSQAAHSAPVTGGSVPGNEAGVQDTAAGSSMGVVAGGVQASSPVESAAEKGSEGGCRLRFADQNVQKAADTAFHNLRVLPAECLSAHLGKAKRTGTATGPKKHA
ncbi:unnamed protein product [Closterium sp. NIES-53]